nr:helicase-related protein [Aeromicrobium stalagmiti]
MLSTGSDRLLIADEVGLGKTIEAGLVWTELEARKSADTVLIVCPSVLVSKWRREMDERFGFDLVELDRASLDEMLEHLEAGRPKPRGAHVASLESLRSWSGLERANELGIHFDLVIVDEAHAFRNLGTKSNALGGLIADWSESLILLSATPLNLRSSDLRNLLEILTPGEFGDAEALQEVLEPNAPLNAIVRSLFDGVSTNADRRSMLDAVLQMRMGSLLAGRHEFVALRELLSQDALNNRERARVRRLVAELHGLSSAITRTRKVEVGDNVIREPQSLKVRWSPEEQHFYEEFVMWCRERARASGTALNFSMQMPLRLVGSCLPMATRDVLDWGKRLASDEFDDLSATTESQLIPPHEGLVSAARAVVGLDSKVDLLRPEVSRLALEGRQALLFTFSRKTLGYLQRQFAGEARVAVLHGGLNKRERHDVMTRFRDGQFDLVIATKVASEGLDFEFCSAVINYDLPWNPMEVEQRIGRIDRIGQRESKIHVINLVTESAIEDDIMNRLLGRIKVFEQSIGDLEPILQSRISDLQQTLLNFELTPEERRTTAEQKLAAIEEVEMTRSDVENASQYLLSSDGVDVDGLGQDLESTGRYVGQDELRLLLQDWAETLGAPAEAVTTPEPRTVRVVGNAEMARSVRGLVARGYRSRLEVEAVASALAAESPIYLSLDQEDSRTGSVDLLTSNHPMVRAALMVPGHRNVRFAHLQVDAQPSVPAGTYLVVVATSQWQGIRPANELWTAGVDLESYLGAPPHVGNLVLARLAAARLTDGDASGADLGYAVDVAKEQLLTRLEESRIERDRDNDALASTRRASVEQVRGRRQRLIESRIATLRHENKPATIPLHEAQLKRATLAAQAALRKIEEGAASDMSVEYLAVCTLEVRS